MTDELPQAYPLHWPPAHNRIPASQREEGLFKVTQNDAQYDLSRELQLMGAELLALSTNVPVRKTDGQPYANTRAPADPAVAVWFYWNKATHVMACDKYTTVRANIRAVGLSIEALRALGRYGCSDILARAFSGFRAMLTSSVLSCWDQLGLKDSDVPKDRDEAAAVIKDAYKIKARTAHPDVGGSVDGFKLLQNARDQALKLAGVV